MNNRPNKESLLEDVLAESAPPDLRAALLGETLRLARRRRQWRQARRVGGALVVVLLTTWLAWLRQPGKIATVSPVVKAAPAKSYQLVETQPFSAGAIVTTKNLATVNIVSSEPSVALIGTSSGGIRFINDEQLLALIGPKPAILIRTGPDSETLFFASLDDQKLLSPR